MSTIMDKGTFASTRQAAGEAILELAREGFNVVAVSADTYKSMYTDLLREEFPHRFFDTGIAEQNMIMTAAGLASTGKIAFAASYSVFTSMRCCEQLRTFVAYPGLNVKVIAGLGGLSAGIEGVTHLATEDLGIMRCIAGMTVIAPADYYATKAAVKAAAVTNGPVYIRVGRESTPVIFDGTYSFTIGKPFLHKSGKDITIVSNGLVTAQALKAVKLLEKKGIDAGLVEMHTIKPVLHPEILKKEAAITGKILTVEEHTTIGGIGTVVSEILAGSGNFIIKKLGLEDVFGESGTPEELLKKYCLDAEGISAEACKLLA